MAAGGQMSTYGISKDKPHTLIGLQFFLAPGYGITAVNKESYNNHRTQAENRHKTVFVALYSSVWNSIPTDFSHQFWEFRLRNGERDDLEFMFMDFSDMDMVNNFLIHDILGADYQQMPPSIFALKRFGSGGVYMPVERYNGSNFDKIAYEFLEKIDSGEIKAQCNHGWNCFYLNFLNPSYFMDLKILKMFNKLYDAYF